MPDVIADLGDYSAPAAGSSDSTAQQLLDQAWNDLYSGIRVERDKLANSISSGATSFDSTYSVGGIKAGAKLSIDLEDFHCWDVSGATATVQPGEFGSTTDAHAAGAIIHVNAEWTPFRIFTELNNELKSLSSPANGLFRVRTTTLTYNPTYFGYDLTGVTNIDGILTVLASTSLPNRERYPISDWRLERNLDTATFASGSALFINTGWPGRDVTVAYRDQFSPLSALSDNVASTTGLPYSAHDILVMGAVLRCASPAEIDRNTTSTQGSGRRAMEVPAGARLNALRGIGNLRAQRIREEAARLSRAYPVRVPRR